MTAGARRQAIGGAAMLAVAVAATGGRDVVGATRRDAPGATQRDTAGATRPDAIAAAAPRVRVIEVARLRDWDLPRGDAWAPSGSQLALETRDRLAIWDASRPEEPPRPILDAGIDDVRWSPDGTWLCCRVRVLNATRGGAVRLQFVPAAGGANEYRIPNAAIGAWFWADDGFLYFWEGQTGERRRVEPPRAWRERGPLLPSAASPQLVVATRGEKPRRAPRAFLFMPAVAGGEPHETALDSLRAAAGIQPWCRFRDRETGAPRWLVTFYGRGGEARTCVVDAAGHRHACLGGAGARTYDDLSVSADGRWALGTVCTRPRDGTAPRCETELLSTSGDWSRPLDEIEGATRAQFDGASSLVALATREPRGVRIVRLEIDHPAPH